MNLSARIGSIVEARCDILIVNLFKGVSSHGGATGAVDRALDGAITELIREEGFDGNLGRTAVIRCRGGVAAKKVLVVGLGSPAEFGVRRIMQAAGAAGKVCRELRAKSVVSILHGAGVGGLAPYDCAKATALGMTLGVYEHNRLKTENAKPNPIESFEIVELREEVLPDVRRGIELAEIVGEAVTFARDLANEPSNVVTPQYLAEIAMLTAKQDGLRCMVLDRKSIESEGMGLLAAVARGSSVEPRFIELRYDSPGAAKTIALVGKGITFDTGGYSLKTSDSMYGMKDDMSGAGAVLAVMRVVTRLKPLVNVVALLPCTENCIGSSAIHPGDVFTSLDGKTVEVTNTDAEGRLILADAIAYAKKIGVDEIIDLATLTGACVVALGHDVAGVFGTDPALVRRILNAGAACGDPMWEMPLWTDYREQIKSDVADLKNASRREGDAIKAALFLSSFAGDVPWAHIDLSSCTAEEDTLLARKGATGAGAGTLVEYLAGFRT